MFRIKRISEKGDQTIKTFVGTYFKDHFKKMFEDDFKFWLSIRKEILTDLQDKINSEFDLTWVPDAKYVTRAAILRLTHEDLMIHQVEAA